MECRPYGAGCVETGPCPTARAVGCGLSSLRDCVTEFDKRTGVSIHIRWGFVVWLIEVPDAFAAFTSPCPTLLCLGKCQALW